MRFYKFTTSLRSPLLPPLSRGVALRFLGSYFIKKRRSVDIKGRVERTEHFPGSRAEGGVK